MTPEQNLITSLTAIVGEDYLSTSIFERLKSSLDIFPYEKKKEELPLVVVLPGNREEVAGIVKYANQEKIPVYVRGSGTSFTGAARYPEPGIVINTKRLNHFSINRDNNYFECGPGWSCNEISNLLAKEGYFLPMAPGSKLVASMGGLISNNTSAHIIDASVGKSGDYVLGVDAVLPTGEILETGTTGLRRPAGNDLTKFFVGGDGLFGVITNIRMRLVPDFFRANGLLIYPELSSMARGVQRLYYDRCPVPLFMEFMDEKTADIGFELKQLEHPGGPVILFVAIGNTQEDADQAATRIVASMGKENPLVAERITDAEKWDILWTTREVIGSYLMQSTGNQWISAEVVSNLKGLEECMNDVVNFTDGLPLLSGLDSYLFGHIGALTMHPGVVLPRDWDDTRKMQAVDEKFAREAELNLKYKTCGGEWGQFAKRTAFFEQRYGQDGLNIIRKMKQVFDPNNILNRGIIR
ncbi:MAG: FAD-binding oxidoreductase [Pseudomonadota bacterium]|nr:FAD-binding oxidoreductase [Pseudomonadota bacterium]